MKHASDIVGEHYDGIFLKAVNTLDHIAGGGPNGDFWWKDWELFGDLEAHFTDTLAKISIDQICGRAAVLQQELERYAITRRECPRKDEICQLAGKAFLKARVTQLEVVAFKSHKKSSKKKERVATAFANFNTEDHMLGKKNGADCVGPPVREFFKAMYGMFGPEDAADAANGGA